MTTKKRSYHTLRDFFMVIFKHKGIVILFFLLALISAFVVGLAMKPLYESSSKLLVKSPETKSAETAAKNSSVTIDTAVEMLTGRYLIESVIKKLGVQALYSDITGTSSSASQPFIQEAVLRIQKNLTVVKGSIIDVRFRHNNPGLASKVVNTLIDEFQDYYLTVQQENQKYTFFKEQLNLMDERLQTSQKQLGLFRNENNISSIQKQKSLLLLQISDLELEQAKVRGEISEMETKAQNLSKSSSERRNFQQTIIALRSRDKKLAQQTTDYKLQLGRLNKAETRLSELERQVKIDEENYLLYSKKTEEARIASAMDASKIVNFAVIEPAMPPINPVRPQKYGIIFVALAIGIVGGLLLAFAAEYFTHTFDRDEDIQDILGCAAAGAFPELDRKEQARLHTLNLPERMQEACNRMEHTISRTCADKPVSILFCAAKENEGVSSLLTSFALTLAGSGTSVLLVDADMRKPSLHKLLSVDPANGLAEALIDGTPVDSLIKDTSVESLKIITAGSNQANPFSLLQSETFDTFLRDVRTRADWVLFDAPSTNFFNDACVIGAKLDRVLLVVTAGKTRWEVAASAMNKFKQCNASMLGAVLNRKKMYIPAWLYKLL